MPLPPRTGLCLQCRTVLMAGERCDQSADHAVANLDDVYGREVAIAAIWGPVQARRNQLALTYRARQSMAGLALLGTVAGAVASVLLWPFLDIVIFSGAVSGTAVWMAGKRALRSRQALYPVGAEPLVMAPGAQLGRRGHVRGEPCLLSPASASECVAYAMELHYEGYWGDRVMYRDAACAAMTVELDGGAIARVPAGRIRVLGTMHQEIDVDNLRLADHLKASDARHAPDGTFDPLRHNVVYEQIILPGDRIELVSAFEPMVTPDAEPTLYRDAAPSVLAPRGVPVLRLLRGHV